MLLNFFSVNLAWLLGSLPRTFWVPEHVEAEARKERSAAQLREALSEGHVHMAWLTESEEQRSYAELRGEHDLGPGESAAMAIAMNGNHTVATDDGDARKAAEKLGWGKTIGTQDIMVMAIRHELISVSQADRILKEWDEQHRFKLKIRSFSELI